MAECEPSVLRGLAAHLTATLSPGEPDCEGRLQGVDPGYGEATIESIEWSDAAIGELIADRCSAPRFRVVEAGGYVPPLEIADPERELLLAADGSTTTVWSAGSLVSIDDEPGQLRLLAPGTWMWVAPIVTGRRCSIVWVADRAR